MIKRELEDTVNSLEPPSPRKNEYDLFGNTGKRKEKTTTFEPTHGIFLVSYRRDVLLQHRILQFLVVHRPT